MFRTLDDSTEARRRRGVAFVCGLLAQVLVLGGAICLALIFPEELPIAAQKYAAVWLAALKPPAPPPVLKPPPPRPPRMAAPRLSAPKLPDPVVSPAPRVVRVETPKVQPALTPPPVRQAALPPAPVIPPPRPPTPPLEVHTGLFGGAPERVTTRRPAEQVQTGGFGSPQALPGHAQGDSAGNLPKLGAFGLPQGPGVGNGTGGAHGVQGVVASAGFGSAVAGPGGGPAGRGEAPKVAIGGFEQAPAAPQPSAPLHDPPAVSFQPVEILSKPTPAYTEQARRSGIQGEVALSVVFQAGGTIRVIGIVKSLGYGLDQAAEQAAAQIRFKPAQRDGRPADFPATLRIEFRLADQST